MVDPCRRATGARFALAGVVALLLAGTVPAARAADSGLDPLAGPFVDVALVASPNLDKSPTIPPRLLVVRPPDPAAPGSIVLELLGLEGAGWSVVARTTITTELAEPGPASLVPLKGTFALVASDASALQTFVTLLTPDATSIRQGAATYSNVGRTATGAADVDGDGSDELILVSDALAIGSGSCDGAWLVVMDGDTLEGPLPRFIPGVGFDGGAIGRFKARGGDDLVAYVHHSCQPEVVPTPTSAQLVDLQTGLRRDLAPPGRFPFGSDSGPLVPLIADLDGDGIDEPILRSGNALVVLDPAKAWRAETVESDAIPLAVIDRTDRPRLVVQEPGTRQAQVQIRLLALGRVGRDGAVIQRGLTEVAAPVSGEPRPQNAANDLATDASAPAPSWAGDLTGNGCVAILVSSATFGHCPADPGAWSARLGPAWLQTVPIAAYGEPGARRLLVAAGVGWATSRPSLAVPDPAATFHSRNARWRTGPSAPFALAVVDPTALTETWSVTAPAISVEPSAIDPSAPRMVVGGGTGDRIFASIGPTLGPGPGESGPLPPAGVQPSAGDVGAFLLARPTEGFGSVAFIPVRGPSGTEKEAGSASFPLPAMEGLALPTVPPTSWTVSVLGLNAFGDASPVLTGRIEIDLTGPSVTVETPFVSPPWPLRASIRGTAEPGARVRLEGRPFVEAARDGSFELQTELAPWPQDVTIDAVDALGNQTIHKVSLVGGFDYRQLPWQALVIVAILVGAGITSLGVPSVRRRSARLAPVAPRPVEAQSVPSAVGQGLPGAIDGEGEIEDLPPVGGHREN